MSGEEVLKHRFAFESPLLDWARDYVVRISEHIARAADRTSYCLSG